MITVERGTLLTGAGALGLLGDTAPGAVLVVGAVVFTVCVDGDGAPLQAVIGIANARHATMALALLDTMSYLLNRSTSLAHLVDPNRPRGVRVSRFSTGFRNRVAHAL